ncbi:phage tail protein [Stutzerimonas sp. KH-1]|jgi:hypothetical protein
MFFSASNGGFYAAEIHGANMPLDVVEITPEEHAALINGQAAGKVIGVDKGGRPCLQDPAPPSAAELTARRRAELLAKLSAVDAASARPLRAILVGSATDADRARLTDLDSQATALRAELASLESPPAA